MSSLGSKAWDTPAPTPPPAPAPIVLVATFNNGLAYLAVLATSSGIAAGGKAAATAVPPIEKAISVTNLLKPGEPKKFSVSSFDSNLSATKTSLGLILKLSLDKSKIGLPVFLSTVFNKNC